jgi:insulysin
MKRLLMLTTLATLPILAQPTFEEMVDLANLELRNPDLASRMTAKIRLVNGVDAYLISDPQADQSAAAIAVGTGSWNDPVDYPGMAHFCEHMLFLGSEKFPDPSEFDTLVANYNGQRNAFTASDRTVYMFSSAHPGFDPILQRFARFFIDPVFAPSHISHELHAVDQEFAKNIENDGWRGLMIFRETGNPDHPNAKFSTGNSATLGRIPQSALKIWHQEHYSSDRMRLVLYSPLPLDELKKMAESLFSEISVSKSTPSDEGKMALSSSSQQGALLSIKPIKESQSLSLMWELPSELSIDPSHPAQLFAYALGRPSSHSLQEQLKREGLIDDLKVSVVAMGGPSHRFFSIDIDLTDEGLEKWQTVALRSFQAIQGLRKSGLPSSLLQELNESVQNLYQFQDRQDPFAFAMAIGASILDGNFATYPRESLLASSYEPEKIERVSSLLTPKTCLFILEADPLKTGISPTKRERWMGAEYHLQKISEEQLHKWEIAAPHPAIRLPDANPFLPSHFNLASEESATPIPSCIAEGASGIAYYMRLEEFKAPKAVFYLHILSPALEASARGTCLGALYLDHLTDRIQPTLGTAALAGLSATFSIDQSRLHTTINGFSDKAALLLEEICRQFSSLDFPSEEEFNIYKSRHAKGYANGKKDLPLIQALELATVLINPGKSTKQENLDALEQISYDDYCDFQRSLFKKTYTEALFAGNVTQEDAEAAWKGALHSLKGKPFPKAQHPTTKILSLQRANSPLVVQEKTSAAGNGAFLLLDLGAFTFEKRAAQEILSAALEEAFFNELRSKQRTGYIAQSRGQETELRLFQSFFVQSNSHQPVELLYRFELFLETYLSDLSESIPEERFQTLSATFLKSLETRFRNLNDKSALWNQLAFQNGKDFAWIEKRMDGFKNLTYDAFLKDVRGFLSRGENRKRLAVLYEGVLPAPFAYEPATRNDIEMIGDYLSRSETITEGIN